VTRDVHENIAKNSHMKGTGERKFENFYRSFLGTIRKLLDTATISLFTPMLKAFWDFPSESTDLGTTILLVTT